MAEDPRTQQISQDPVNTIITEFGTRLSEIEEKQRLIKDRVLLVGENLISTKEDIEKQNLEFKKQISELQAEIKLIKQITKRVINELQNFARKPELEILERQIKMFQPLELARIKDVKDIINQEISKSLKPIKS